MPKFIKLTMIAGQRQNDLEQVSEDVAPVYINAEQVREFYPRREGRNGTRISLLNGAGIPVAESVEEVLTLLTA